MVEANYRNTGLKKKTTRRKGLSGRRLQPPGAASPSRSRHTFHPSALSKDQFIERSLRRMKNRQDAAAAHNIISLLARRATDIQSLRRTAEAIACFKPGAQSARALNILKRAVIKDRQATLVLPEILLQNQMLLHAKGESLIIFAHIYPLVSWPEIIGFLGPDQLENLADAYKNATAMFPGPDMEKIFFAVLSQKIQQEENPYEKVRVASTWSANLISLLHRINRIFQDI
jgi:hypothetical protein